MTDFSAIMQTSVTLAGFLIGVNAFLPKGLEEEWFAYAFFLIPSPVLFLVTAALAAYTNDLALSLFSDSIVVLIILFVGLGVWSTWEKYTEHELKEKLRTRNPALFQALTASL
ncbi:MAG: hypothetical protein OK452_10655 [Thaumarchaeota archaeon]|nr:hypothetical protein [Nitrososphaerota archaeon]